MQADFWHQRWQENQIGFHLSLPHSMLSGFLSTQSWPPSGNVFVPLCGKTLDISYLLDKGYQVHAIELSEIAVKQLFESMKLTPAITQHGDLKSYKADNLTVYVGDIFKLTKSILGPVDWVYDRAALVALPLEMRLQYVAHLQQITNQAPQLLITIEYDQQLMDGPPFAIDSSMVKDYYQQNYDCYLYKECAIEGGLKGKADALEKLWVLNKV